jgi:hypothetical protein
MATFLRGHDQDWDVPISHGDGPYPDAAEASQEGRLSWFRLYSHPNGSHGLVVYVPSLLSHSRADVWFDAYVRRRHAQGFAWFHPPTFAVAMATWTGALALQPAPLEWARGCYRRG